MRFLPDKQELLALGAVWLIYPVLLFAEWAVSPLFRAADYSLPWPVWRALNLLNWNHMLIPSLIGTGCVILAARISPSPETKRFLCHVITFVTFCFTVVVISCVLSSVRAVIPAIGGETR